MSYPINYPTSQNANVQIFTEDTTVGEAEFTWVKPQGASFVWFTLIGAGGTGYGGAGGGSGAVTNFMCPAFLIPDSLQIRIGDSTTQNHTIIWYHTYQINAGGTDLLTAETSSYTTAGNAMTSNFFTCMGFFQSVAGQNGGPGNISAATNTFLSGGSLDTQSQTSNYGYSSGPPNTDRTGFFQFQPIIVGTSGMGNGKGGIGCGGGHYAGGGVSGGPGLVVIITW